MVRQLKTAKKMTEPCPKCNRLGFIVWQGEGGKEGHCNQCGFIVETKEAVKKV